MAENPGGGVMNKPAALSVLALTQVAIMSLWFTTAAVAPALQAEFALSTAQIGWLTSAVQLGFVAGCLISAGFGLADRLDSRRFYAACAIVGGSANGLFLLVDPGSMTAIALRFLTGAAMAGVYPVGMKIAVSWADRDRGLLVGLLVGALTVGNATPHLFAFLGGVDWRFVMIAATVAAFCGAGAVLTVPMGPAPGMTGRFDPGAAWSAWTDRATRYANFGYLGHMWELFAMWAWIAAYLTASFAVGGIANAGGAASLAAFATIAVGAVGAFAGGWLADRIGRTALTVGALLVSGLCCLAAGPAFGAAPALVTLLCLVWGIAVIADSAQFSACVSELAKPGTQGTMLTVQTATGFALSVITIQLMPAWVDYAGWRWAFAPLAVGPLLGAFAMARLRTFPDATKLAHGLR